MHFDFMATPQGGHQKELNYCQNTEAPLKIAKFRVSILHLLCENIFLGQIKHRQNGIDIGNTFFSEMLKEGPDSGRLSNNCKCVNIIKSG